jgi:hypothetical protein
LSQLTLKPVNLPGQAALILSGHNPGGMQTREVPSSLFVMASVNHFQAVLKVPVSIVSHVLEDNHRHNPLFICRVLVAFHLQA